MPKLSIIIVSYNVKYFLDQLLQSIYKSETDFDYEVIVVDNNSPDHSADYIKERFSDIVLLAKDSNAGYATANNEGIKIANGEYVLLLNPDTLLQQDTLQKSVDFIESHSDAGSVGVRMIDGSGHFLPESKRGLPTPWVSFSKMLGLHKLFPSSARFNQYYLGFLDSEKTHAVDVLTGAYFLTRKKLLDQINGLDERYFMYGEDIDLSYKIQQAGYKNYYYPETQIIRYKGESTNSDSISRNKNFYTAMILFAENHLAQDWSIFKKWFIKIGIVLAAIVGFGVKKISKLIPYVLEVVVFLIGFIWIKNLWAIFIYKDINYYDPIFNTFNAPLYAFIWLMALIFSGSYDKYPRWRYSLFGASLGLVVVLLIYALLPFHLRSSRPIIFISFVWVLMSIGLIRTLWSRLSTGKWLAISGVENNVLIFGLKNEVRRAHKLFLDLNQQSDKIEHFSIVPEMDRDMVIFKLDQIIQDKLIDDLIICNKGFDFNFIIGLMSQMRSQVRFRLLPEFSSSIIGSDSSRKKGEIYTLEINFSILNPIQKRLKRLLDLGILISLFIIFPIIIYLIAKGRLTLRNIAQLIMGKSSWVGYDRQDENIKELPNLKKGVFPITSLYKIPLDKEGIHQINKSYALNYSIMDDLRVMISRL